MHLLLAHPCCTPSPNLATTHLETARYFAEAGSAESEALFPSDSKEARGIFVGVSDTKNVIYHAVLEKCPTCIQAKQMKEPAGSILLALLLTHIKGSGEI